MSNKPEAAMNSWPMTSQVPMTTGNQQENAPSPLAQTHFDMSAYSMSPPPPTMQYQPTSHGEPVASYNQSRMNRNSKEISSWTIPTSQYNQADYAKPIIVDGQLPPGAYYGENSITFLHLYKLNLFPFI